jgi:hypothetical protein
MTDDESTPPEPEKPEGWLDDEIFEACVQKEMEYRRLRRLASDNSYLAGDAHRLSKKLREVHEILGRHPALGLALLQGGVTQLLVVGEEARKIANSRSATDQLDREIDKMVGKNFDAYRRVKEEGRKRFKEDNPTE